ncbi:Mitogen-activated protein kinase kinase kinase protein [Dioscorea alata]|nr:Mitogen-activated protein kinase kinase kinase protein [Dioscorea alata]
MSENLLSNNQLLATPPKAGVLSKFQSNLQSPQNGAFASAPDSPMSSPSRSPIRVLCPEQILTAAPKPYPGVNFIGSRHCSSPGSGQTSGHNSVVGDMPGHLLWQHSRGSPERSPIFSPRLASPGPGSRIHSSAASPRHPRTGGLAPESPTSWHDEGKKNHRLPLPPSKGSCWKKGKLIGRGTFGHVFVGFNSDSGETCAMKEVTLFSDDAKSRESAKQLVQEIALLSQLQHPNIVRYYGCDMIDDKLYIYLEFVSGGSIHKLLQEHGPLGEQAIRSFTRQILSGLAYLHAKATVHRDIKGANILVDPNGRVKLADFGMAKYIARKSRPLSFKGSPYWMAPEVVKKSTGCNLSADIWSLGCTVLEMATSKPPWSQYEGIAAIFKIGNSKDLPAIPDHLSEDGQDFIRSCLQRDPFNRPTSNELLQHPFVRNVVPMEKSILNPKLGDQCRRASIGGSFRVFGDVGNLSSLDRGLIVHQPRGARTALIISDSHARNMSCPVSPIVSPLLSPRSQQHIIVRMSPPISSPLTTSGSSTALTGGNGAIPFNQTKRLGFPRKGLVNTIRPKDNIHPLGYAFHGQKHDHYCGGQQYSSASDILMANGHLREPNDK